LGHLSLEKACTPVQLPKILRPGPSRAELFDYTVRYSATNRIPTAPPIDEPARIARQGGITDGNALEPVHGLTTPKHLPIVFFQSPREAFAHWTIAPYRPPYS